METDSSLYLTNCCDFEFMGRENNPFFFIPANLEHDSLFSCKECGRKVKFTSIDNTLGTYREKSLYRNMKSSDRLKSLGFWTNILDQIIEDVVKQEKRSDELEQEIVILRDKLRCGK